MSSSSYTVMSLFSFPCDFRLVLKKVEVKESHLTRIINKIKGLFRRSPKPEKGEGKTPSTEPVVVEENPLYDDREELENIMEEEEEEDEQEDEKDSCKPTEGDTRKDR